MREVGVATPGVVILGPEQQRDLQRLILPPDWTARCRTPDEINVPAILNAFFRAHPDLPWYGVMMDDVIVRTKEWDTRMVMVAGRDCFVSANDGWQAPRRMHAAVVFGGDLLRAMGFWCLPALHHCYLEDVWEDVAWHCGNWTVMMDVMLEHIHPARPECAAQFDATYRLQDQWVAADRATWERFRDSDAHRRLIDRVAHLIN